MSRVVAVLAVMLALAPTASASVRTGLYRNAARTVSCDWEPRGDYVQCANASMARRGAYLYIDSLNGAGHETGEVVAGGRVLRPGTQLEAGSVVCTFARSYVRCSNRFGVKSGFKLSARSERLWG